MILTLNLISATSNNYDFGIYSFRQKSYGWPCKSMKLVNNVKFWYIKYHNISDVLSVKCWDNWFIIFVWLSNN